MVKDWRIHFQDFNENVIEIVQLKGLTIEEVSSYATEQSKKNKAHTYSYEQIKKEERWWIKSKVAVVLGLNNQYAGMCLVESPKDIKKVEEKYPFPYIVQVVEDIPSMEDFLNSKKD